MEVGRCEVHTAVEIKNIYIEDGTSAVLQTLAHINLITWCHILELVDVNTFF
jgi:hypothetical protein